MDDLDRPTFGLYVDEEIEAALHEVDTSYFKQLREMQVFIYADVAPLGFLNPQAPSPKRPARVRAILDSYARALFHGEAKKYPRDPRLPRWLRMLAERTQRRVMDTVAKLEAGRLNSLTYHGDTVSHMSETVDEAIRRTLEDYLQGLASDAHPQETTTTMSVRKATSQQDSTLSVKAEPAKQSVDATNEEEIERRKKLLEEYKAATDNPSNKRIYESSNSKIHKPQFYRWVNGTLPFDSATTENFERFLREKKQPIPKRPKD